MDDDDDTFYDASGVRRDVEISFDMIAGRLNEYIDTEGVDNEVHIYYNNILRAGMLFPIQTAYMASAYQLALSAAYEHKRQHQREALVKSRKFNGVVKMWVLEVSNVNIKAQLPELEAEQRLPSLAVRASIEAASKLTTRGTPSRNYDGTFEPLKINQDLDFYIKRPTSILHVDLVHLNDDVPQDSLQREVLVGHLLIPVRKLESQKMVRQLYPVTYNGVRVAEIKLRLQYTYKEEQMATWDPESGMPRPPDQGGPEFILGIIGAGQIGSKILQGVLRCGSFRASQVKVSTRGPERLELFQKLGVSCGYDDAAVAQRADVLVIAVLPSQLPQVARDVRGHIRPTSLVISLVAGAHCSAPALQSLRGGCVCVCACVRVCVCVCVMMVSLSCGALPGRRFPTHQHRISHAHAPCQEHSAPYTYSSKI
jgi:hypothetical protein